MFDYLIESGGRRARRRLWASGAVALAAHATLAIAAVWITLRPIRGAAAAGPPLVIAWPEEPRGPTPEVNDALPLPRAPVVAIPTFAVPVASALPLARWSERIPGWESADASPSRAATRGDGAWSASVVEEPPQLLTGPPAAYPEWLRAQGIEGRVVVEVVIDTLGRPEPAALTLVASSHPGFEPPAREFVLRARFRPGRSHGRAVRVLVRLPIAFALQGQH